LGLKLRNEIWTFIKCPFSEKAESPLQKPDEKSSCEHNALIFKKTRKML
jgi:hypothetical protein